MGKRKQAVRLNPVAALAIAFILGQLGGTAAMNVMQDRVIQHFLGRGFDLADIYRMGGTIALLGSALTGAAILATSKRWIERWITIETLRELSRQTGRQDLTEGQRVAIAYVLDDIRNAAKKGEIR